MGGDLVEKNSRVLEERQRIAVDAVRIELDKDSVFQVIPESAANPSLKGSSAIWRTKINVSGKDREVDIGLSKLFPDDPPRAYVNDWEELFLRNPHVMKGGFLCTIPSSAAIDSSDPVGLFRHVYEQAQAILVGVSTDDFKEEFSYYWNKCTKEGAQSVLIINPIENLGGSFPVVFKKGYVCIASSVERLNEWIKNLTGKQPGLTEKSPGILISLPAPLLPQDYPATLKDLLSLSETADNAAAEMIKDHIVNSHEKGLVLLSQKEGEGVAYGGIIFEGLELCQSRSVELTHGFRQGRVPRGLLLERASNIINATVIIRSRVVRADHKWIHSRGGDGQDLSQRSVLLIGCGSLGGYVAHLLARAGVGKLTLIDNDLLGWENVGRNILGASSVDLPKAGALAEKLKQELPHLTIEGVIEDWRNVFDSEPGLFLKNDLIISTTADWRCEKSLNFLAKKTQMPPILLGWLEPYAVAGHCLLISRNGGCFECGANEFGQFQDNVANFRTKTISKEPGGCAYYQHYGPTSLMPVASMISSVAIESLINTPSDSFLHTWISNEKHFRLVEAEIADGWKQLIGNGGYSRIFEKVWAKSNACSLCNLSVS